MVMVMVLSEGVPRQSCGGEMRSRGARVAFGMYCLMLIEGEAERGLRQCCRSGQSTCNVSKLLAERKTG